MSIDCPKCGKHFDTKNGFHGHLRFSHDLRGDELTRVYESTIQEDTMPATKEQTKPVEADADLFMSPEEAETEAPTEAATKATTEADTAEADTGNQSYSLRRLPQTDAEPTEPEATDESAARDALVQLTFARMQLATLREEADQMPDSGECATAQEIRDSATAAVRDARRDLHRAVRRCEAGRYDPTDRTETTEATTDTETKGERRRLFHRLRSLFE